MAATAISRSASPADFSSTRRKGGVNIWAAPWRRRRSSVGPRANSTVYGINLRRPRGSGNVPCLRPGRNNCTHETTDAPLVPRRLRRSDGRAGVRRPGAKKGRAAPGRAALRHRRRGHRRRRRRDSRRPSDRRRGTQMRRCSKRRALPAAAASPTPRPSAWPTIVARTGCICRKPIRWHGSPPSRASTSIPRRPASACASAGAMPARARWRIAWRRWRAPTPPSPTPRARPTSPAPRRCRRILANGARPLSSCSGRSPSARIWRRSRPPISPAPPNAASMPSAGRVSARC